MTTGDARPLRLFVAVEVPHAELESAATQLTGLREGLAAGRWTSLANQHVTLKFLGAVPREVVPPVDEAIAAVAATHRSAVLRLNGLGAFPSPRRARVLWLGLDDPQGRLREMAAALDAALGPLGFSSEKRAFTPHLTLARFKAPVRLPEPLPPVEEGRPFEVGSLVLFRSRLHPQGARYEPLRAFRLRGGVQ